MIYQKNQYFAIIDNSGVRKLKCIGFSKAPLQIPYRQVLGSVQYTRSSLSAKSSAVPKKGQLMWALLVRFRTPFSRITGFSIFCDSTCAILLNSSNRPIGSKIKGFLFKDLRQTRFLRVASLSEGLI